jgi:pyridoxine 4-dehydrogenase
MSRPQVAEGRRICRIVCVQNLYNLTDRSDDALVETLAREGIPYVAYFPLGGIRLVRSPKLSEVARRLNASPMQIAIAWLLHRSPNLLPIPGTSSLTHLRENIAAGTLELPESAFEMLSRNELAG